MSPGELAVNTANTKCCWESFGWGCSNRWPEHMHALDVVGYGYSSFLSLSVSVLSYFLAHSPLIFSRNFSLCPTFFALCCPLLLFSVSVCIAEANIQQFFEHDFIKFPLRINANECTMHMRCCLALPLSSSISIHTCHFSQMRWTWFDSNDCNFEIDCINTDVQRDGIIYLEMSTLYVYMQHTYRC